MTLIILIWSLIFTATLKAASPVDLRRSISAHRAATWVHQQTMGLKPTRTAHSELRTRSKRYLRWLNAVWLERRLRWKARAENPPHLREWLCIHRYEGSWRDPGAPYYGGLQMDIKFQRAYGWNLLKRKGTADHWTPFEQMWVAERAWRKRGFSPWPNTARYCKLL